MPLHNDPDSTKTPDPLAEDFSDLELIEDSIDKQIQWLSKFPEAQAWVARLQLVARLTIEAYHRGEIEETDAMAVLDKEVHSDLSDMHASLIIRDKLIVECDEFLQQPNIDPQIKESVLKIKRDLDYFKTGVPQRFAIQHLSTQLSGLRVQQNIISESPVSRITNLLQKGVDRLGITRTNKD